MQPTPQELQALTQLLSRTPMTAPERLWAQGFVERLAARHDPSPSDDSTPDAKEQDEY